MNKKFTDILTNNSRLIIWLIIVIALIWLVYVIKKKSSSTDNETVAELEEEIETLEISDSDLTITDNDSTLIAQNLLAAMNRYGTDDETIINNLTGLNGDDLLLVMKKFGVKPYNGAGLATRSYEIKYFAQDLNLIGWLKRELSDSKDTLAQVSEIFQLNGISF